MWGKGVRVRVRVLRNKSVGNLFRAKKQTAFEVARLICCFGQCRVRVTNTNEIDFPDPDPYINLNKLFVAVNVLCLL